MIKHIKKLKACLLDTCPADECLALLRTFSDETRQEIIKLFAIKKEWRANDVAENFTLSRPTISHHLNLMKRAKILNSRKNGKEIYYSFNKKYAVKLLTSILNSIKKSC